MAAVLKVLKRDTPVISDDVQASVAKAIEGNYPFIMLAKRPSGEWEQTEWWPTKAVSDYEIVGVLERAKHRVLYPDDEEGEGTG